MTQHRHDDEELAAAGAAWWADTMMNRADKPAAGTAAVDAAASLLSDVPPPLAHQVEAFREHLKDGLIAALSRSAGRLTVRMRYNPDAILGAALEASGIGSDDGVIDLPWHTTMEFRDGQITVVGPASVPTIEHHHPNRGGDEEVDREEICGGGCELPEGSCPACLGAI